jgi:hypothetical protein
LTPSSRPISEADFPCAVSSATRLRWPASTSARRPRARSREARAGEAGARRPRPQVALKASRPRSPAFGPLRVARAGRRGSRVIPHGYCDGAYRDRTGDLRLANSARGLAVGPHWSRFVADWGFTPTWPRRRLPPLAARAFHERSRMTSREVLLPRAPRGRAHRVHGRSSVTGQAGRRVGACDGGSWSPSINRAGGG